MHGKEAIRLTILAAVLAATLAFAAPAASAAVVYDQADNVAASGVFSVADTSGTDSSEVADDLVAPAGETWTLESVFVDGINDLLAADVGAMSVHLYAGAGTLPGAQLFGASGVAPVQGPTDDYPLPTAGAPVLNPGTYWISVQAEVDYPAHIWDWSGGTAR